MCGVTKKDSKLQKMSGRNKAVHKINLNYNKT